MNAEATTRSWWRRWLRACCDLPPAGDDVGVVVDRQDLPVPGHGPRHVVLPIPHLRQEDWLCVPTAAAMVLAAFGKSHSPRELKALSRGLAYDPAAPFSDFSITLFRDLAAGLARLGQDWREASYRTDRAGFRQGLAALQASLRQGRPALVDTGLFGGHTVVVAGFDDVRRCLWVVDPHLDAPGWRALPYPVVEQVWHSRDAGFDGRGALFPQSGRISECG